MTTNLTLSLLKCPEPFLKLDDFPYSGGFREGRLCQTVLPELTCCLPCPVADWVYPDSFQVVSQASSWVAVVSLACCCVLLISFACLPVQRTSRHYLTICLIIATGLMALGFIVPLGSKPAQCHDKITPNDMRSDLSCAFSGSLETFGGFAAVMWVFIRSLSLHLQIYWQITPGRKFFLASLLAGWGIPALFIGLSLGLSGLSYRLASVCHINHDKSLGTFWAPILVFTGFAAILQFVTFGYCIRVYIRSLIDSDNTTSQTSSSHHGGTGTSSKAGTNSVKTVGARATYRRVRQVVALQWRGVMVVLILIVSAIYFSFAFLSMDAMQTRAMASPANIEPWISCLVANKGDKTKCFGKTTGLVLGEAASLAVLFLLALMGIWCLIFLGRVSMIYGWWELIRSPFRSGDDNFNFVSVDAKRVSDPRTYEMLKSPHPTYAAADRVENGDGHVVGGGISSPIAAVMAYKETKGSGGDDFGAAVSPASYGTYGTNGESISRDAEYRERTYSFSQPRPPSRRSATVTTPPTKPARVVTFSGEYSYNGTAFSMYSNGDESGGGGQQQQQHHQRGAKYHPDDRGYGWHSPR